MTRSTSPANQSLEAVSSFPGHRAAAAPPAAGVIARYARFTDYHDILGERFKNIN